MDNACNQSRLSCVIYGIGLVLFFFIFYFNPDYKGLSDFSSSCISNEKSKRALFLYKNNRDNLNISFDFLSSKKSLDKKNALILFKKAKKNKKFLEVISLILLRTTEKNIEFNSYSLLIFPQYLFTDKKFTRPPPKS